MPEIRTGMALRWQGETWIVVSFKHTHKGRGGATMTVKMRNILTGGVREATVRESDEFEELRVERFPGVYSYTAGEDMVFFNNETYEEVTFPHGVMDPVLPYIKEGTGVTLLYIDGVPASVEPPNFVELAVTETTPGVRGDTASGGSKPAKLETGLVIQVPLFIEAGDTVRVDTRDDRYIERV
jgi:elongation factor P